MAHPYVMVNGDRWIIFLEHFRDTIAAIARLDKKTDAEIAELSDSYVRAIEDNRNKIFLATASGMVRYIHFYNVAPKEGAYDEFKGIYFIGMAVSLRLLDLGLADLNKLHLRAMLRLLDMRLREPYDIRRPTLSERILSLINNGANLAIDEHLGTYGWYLIYKCLYNSVHGKSRSI